MFTKLRRKLNRKKPPAQGIRAPTQDQDQPPSRPRQRPPDPKDKRLMYQLQNDQLEEKFYTWTNRYSANASTIRLACQGTLRATSLLLDYDLNAYDPRNIECMLSDLFVRNLRGAIDVSRLWSGIGVTFRNDVPTSRRLLVWDERYGRHERYGRLYSPSWDAIGKGSVDGRKCQTYHLLAVWKGPP